MLEDTAQALGAKCAGLCLMDPEEPDARLILTRGMLVPEPHLGAPPPFSGRSEPWPGIEASAGPPPAILRDIFFGDTLLMAGVGPGAERDLSGTFPGVGPRLGCPVPGDGAAGGALFFGREEDEPEFTSIDIALLSAFASQVALRAERVVKADADAAHEQREAAIAELADTCMSAASLEMVLSHAVDEVHRTLGPQRTCLWQLKHGPQVLELTAVRGMPYAPGTLELPGDFIDPLAEQALVVGEVVRVHHPQDLPGGFPVGPHAQAEIGAAAAFPILAQDRPYGSLVVYLRQASELSDADVRFVKSVVDLAAVASATQEAEERRAMSEAVFRAAVANSPVPLLVYETNGPIVASSRSVWESLGQAEDSVGRIDDWFELAFPDAAYRARMTRRLDIQPSSARGARSLGDAEVACADGTIRIWTLRHDAVEYANHPPLHFLAALDVTEERQAQADLRQATKMEAVGRLAGGIAHDFNNLLTVITGYVDIALDRIEETHPVHKPLTEIALASEKASQLTDKLLAFSRHRKPELRALDLNAVVSNLMGMVGRVIGEGISCELDLDPHAPSVRLDRGGLEQTLLNMFVNARDAMGDEGVIGVRTVHLQHGEIPPGVAGPAVEGAHGLLLMSDTGCGMPPEVLSRIFEPFFTTKEAGVGTGLGLAGAYATISQAEGEIRVVSGLDEGTTFGILLPAVPEEPSDPELIPTSPPAHGTETVLIAEDRAQVRNFAADALRPLGYRVLTAFDGVDALEVAAAHRGPIHVLLTDVIMPHMGGIELAAQMRALRDGIRVVFMSGYPGKDLSTTLPPAHEAKVLRKPFTANFLGHRIRQALDEAP